MPTPYPRSYPLPRHFAEQETLDDFAEQMAALEKGAERARELESRIDTAIERAKESVRPKKKEPSHEPVRPDP